MTLVRLLDRAAGTPERGVRFLDRAERPTWIPWHEMRRRARAVCGGLQALGVGPGDRVAVVFPTGPEFFDAFFGTLMAGAVPVPLYPPVRLGRLDEYYERTARMLASVRARAVLASKAVHGILGPAILKARPPLGCRIPAHLPAGPTLPERVVESNLALVQFSSGTTVEPKPVALSHRALIAQVEALNSYWPDRNGTRHSGASWLPLYHDMGLVGCVLTALERPADLTLIPPELFVARPAVWLRAISRYGATVSPAPSFAYGLCVEKIRDDELDGVDLSCWRVALDGAEPVAPGVVREFQRRFARWGFRAEAITPVYGLSEAALAVSFSDPWTPFVSARFCRATLAERGEARPDDEGVELVSVGRPLPGFALRVVDEVGEELDEGRVGRVLVRGPSLMEGYLDRPDATARALADDWLDTGDLGFVRGGDLYLTGRAKDVLILRGRNHSPTDVERAVDGVPGARTGCAVAVSHAAEGASSESLLVFVEARRGVRPESFETIAGDCKREILAATGLEAADVRVLRPGTLPRTSSGKLRRQETLRLHLRGGLRPPAPVTALRLARAVARSRFDYARARWTGNARQAD